MLVYNIVLQYIACPLNGMLFRSVIMAHGPVGTTTRCLHQGAATGAQDSTETVLTSLRSISPLRFAMH
jgi:hypothetical protein